MDPIALLRMAVESIASHKLRSSLVTLGILIGITAVLVNAAMVEGVQAYFEKQMQSLGSNFVTIQAGSVMSPIASLIEDQNLESYLYDSVRRLPYVDKATASRTSFGTIRYMGEEEDIIVLGVEPGYLPARNREMVAGDTLALQDRFNAVVTDTVMRNLALRPVTLMSQFELVLNVDGTEVYHEFRIKGVVKEAQSFGRTVVYIPIRTLNDLLGKEGYSEITLFASDIEHIDTVKEGTIDMLDRLLHVQPDRSFAMTQEEEGFFGLPLPLAEGEREEYTVTTQSDIIKISEEITAMIQLALVTIAGISLLVGGIGIANVMLVTVAERTREIGVMKAVGAKNRQVLVSFLFEAGVIGLLGGILGLSIASMAAFTLIPLVMDVPGGLPVQWAVIAIGISLTISLISGLYPALRASRMDPVQALRTE